MPEPITRTIMETFDVPDSPVANIMRECAALARRPPGRRTAAPWYAGI